MIKKILTRESVVISFVLTTALILFYIFKKHGFMARPCFLYNHFNIFCPACGCTRAIIALFQFNIIKSLQYNPIVLYLGIAFYGYMVFDIFVLLKKINEKKLMMIRRILIGIGVTISLFFTIWQNIK